MNEAQAKKLDELFDTLDSLNDGGAFSDVTDAVSKLHDALDRLDEVESVDDDVATDEEQQAKEEAEDDIVVCLKVLFTDLSSAEICCRELAEQAKTLHTSLSQLTIEPKAEDL